MEFIAGFVVGTIAFPVTALAGFFIAFVVGTIYFYCTTPFSR